MTKERKKLISYLTAVIILFGGGVGLGYYIWGLDKQKKPDYKKYLSKTIGYIGNIEKDNRGFIKQVKLLKTDIAALKNDMKDAKIQFDAQYKSLQNKSASIEKEKEQLHAKIDQLINELDTVKQKIIDIESPVSEVKELAEQEVESPVSEEKEPAEQEVESPVSEEKGNLEEKGHQSEMLPGSSD